MLALAPPENQGKRVQKINFSGHMWGTDRKVGPAATAAAVDTAGLWHCMVSARSGVVCGQSEVRNRKP